MWIAALLLLLAFPTTASTVYEGKVVHIADGDTLSILWQGKPLKVCLAEIDTPEKRRPFGTQAKNPLATLAFGKRARVVASTKDRYGRTIGRIYVDGIDVNAELVRTGFAPGLGVPVLRGLVIFLRKLFLGVGQVQP